MDRRQLQGAIEEIDVLIDAERAASKARIEEMRKRKAALVTVLRRYERADKAAALAIGGDCES